MTPLKQILLVDDDRATNYLHKRIIMRYGCADDVVEMRDGEQALEYLATAVDGVYPKPELIFLDLNMPKMNGWEFLEAYDELPRSQQGGEVIVMLTTSLNPDDRNRAEQVGIVSGFRNKPLNDEMLDEVLEQYYPAAKRA